MGPSGYGNTSRPCFPRPVRCSIITTVPSTSIKVAKAHYGASVQALEWVEATMTRLYLGKVGAVLGGLRRMQAHVRRSGQSDCQLLGLSQ